ncbi:MAG TPA: aminoacyl-tRNA hydrolase [Thermoanaerobaculia bacterium]|nr:aminoacyl-tRNA hydrolase [Thermoanaerobaculia bacterium]
MARLILGLGNPGPTYRETRHNVGFRVVEELARRRGLALDRAECGALTASSPDLTLANPQLYMNRSGYAARCLIELYGFAPEEILVVYDEVALPLGRLRLRASGSPGGHRGMESILEQLRTDQVPRLRLGVAGSEGPPLGEGLADYVLGPFPDDEKEAVEAMILRAADACEAWASEGAEAAMSRFNG